MTSQSAGTLRSRYAAQAASDLEENRRRQRELAERISVLKQEEALLLDILSLAERYEGGSDASRPPEQAQDGPAVPEPSAPEEEPASAAPAPAVAVAEAASAVADTEQAPAAADSPRPVAEATGADSAAKAGAKGKPGRPLLGDLLAGLLGEHDEPRPAKELRDELLQKHPGRNPTPQVVRNTLESLVAKGRIRRHKRDRAVLYTLVKPDSD